MARAKAKAAAPAMTFSQAAAFVMTKGIHKGKTLDAIANESGGFGFLKWFQGQLATECLPGDMPLAEAINTYMDGRRINRAVARRARAAAKHLKAAMDGYAVVAGAERYRWALNCCLAELYTNAGDLKAAQAAYEMAVGEIWQDSYDYLCESIEALTNAWGHLQGDRPFLAWMRIVEALPDLIEPAKARAEFEKSYGYKARFNKWHHERLASIPTPAQLEEQFTLPAKGGVE